MYASCSNNNDDAPASIYLYIDEYYETLNKEFSNYGGVNRESANLTIDSINNIKIIQALTNDKSYFVFCVLDIEKNRIINKASIEEPFNLLSIHEGYGVYKDYSFRNISDPNFVKTDNGFVSYSQIEYYNTRSNIGIVAFSNGSRTICKTTEEPYFSLKSPLLSWYKNSVLAYDNNKAVIIADTGEVLYELFAPWNFQAIKQGCVIKTLSYTEAVLWGGNGFERYITRYNFGDYKTGYSDIKWQVDFYESAKVEGDVKCTYEIKSTNGNKYSCVAHITEYSGAKKDISFELDIDEGTIKM